MNKCITHLWKYSAVAMAILLAGAASAQSPEEEPAEKTREIFVPYSDLKVILDSGPQRVLLSRQQYDELLKTAKKAPETHVPHPAAAFSSDYDMTVEEGRARIRGTLLIDVLEEGLHLVPLDLGGVGLLSATLDDRPAAIGRNDDGQLNLLVSGLGRHRLALDMIAPLEMTSAQQVMAFRLASAAVGHWRLTAPGDVEIKGGGDVVSREVDAAANVTRFTLLPRGGDTRLLMSLNSHLRRRDQAVAARCVVFDEVTEAYERLHATMTFWVLHRAVDRFSFYVPDGFEVTQIESPLLARWDVGEEEGGKRKVANVRLREPAFDTVVVSVSAIKTPSQLKKWHLPRLELRDVVSQVAVLGLVVQSDLKTESLSAENLIAVDTTALADALPASLARQEADALPRTFVAAYYAPQAAYDLKADFTRAPATLAVTTHLLLNVRDQGGEVQGGFTLAPTTEKRFDFDFNVPAGWNVTQVSGPDGRPLAIERYTSETEPGRVHVKLPQGIAPGQTAAIDFLAVYTPAGWLSPGKSQSLEFPMFSVAGAASDEGALAVAADDDLEVRPDKLARLVPIVEEEKARFGLANSATVLAYRYEAAGAKAALVVDRKQARITARTFAFFRAMPEGLAAHYEVIYMIDGGKTRRLALLLPASTPEKLKIAGLGGVSVKEFVSEPAGDMRRWNVLLGDACRGEVRLAVDFQLPSDAWGGGEQGAGSKGQGGRVAARHAVPLALPLLQADDVVYQSGLVAVEGGAELDVQVKADAAARRADVGQLAPAEYQPGRRLLGAYSFVGSLPKIAIDVVRNPSYSLIPAIIERADFKTLLSADGNSQTQANFQLRTKALYLEVALPKDATLWSAVLDRVPLKPQKKAGVCLLGLPPGSEGASRNLQLVYQAPVAPVLRGGRLQLAAPRLLYRAAGDSGQPAEIPLVNAQWTVTVPAGYVVTAADGTLEPQRIERPAPAPLVVADVLLALGRGYGVAGDGTEKSAAVLAAPRGEQSGLGFQNSANDADFAVRDTTSSMAKAKDGEQAGRRDQAWAIIDHDDNEPGKDHKVGITQNNMDTSRYAIPSVQLRPENGLANPSPAPGLPSPPMSAYTAPPAAPYPGPAMPSPFPSAAVTFTPAPPPPAAPSAPLLSDGTPLPPLAAPTRRSATSAPEARPDSAKPAETPPADGLSPSGGWGAKWSGASAEKPAYRGGSLLGADSLNIEIQQDASTTYALEMSYNPETGTLPRHLGKPAGEQVITFTSLGASPELGITLADRSRLSALCWAVGLIVFLGGVAITARPARRKFALVLGLGVASALLPLIWDTVSMASLCNAVFYAASWLVPYYLLAGLLRWLAGKVAGVGDRWLGRAATAALLVMAISAASSMTRAAEPPAAADEAATPQPVSVPEDALIVPYDGKSESGVEKADHLLVPYSRYVELWNRAHPDKKLDAHPAPLPYTLSGAAYEATLAAPASAPAAQPGNPETLSITGQISINVLTDDFVSIPLNLRGGVLTRAMLDGKPAQLKIVAAQAEPTAQSKFAVPPPGADATLFLLQLAGKGSHKLELEVRLNLARTGGWRRVAAALPSAPAATVTFRIPQPQTEVRTGQSVDRRSHETTRPDETIETALGPDGGLELQWRPKVAEAQVDRGLTVESSGVFDIEEDGLRMAVNMKLEFRRPAAARALGRDAFTLSLPADYLLEKVAGINVRGWEVRRSGTTQAVEVSLLKTAKDSEQISLFLARSGRVGVAPLDSFAVPCVTVSDAALSSGQITIRRSVLLDVRTARSAGMTRVDTGSLPDVSGGPGTEESVLAIRPYEAYRFAAMPFELRLEASPLTAEVTADAQTRVTVNADGPGLESKIAFHTGARKIYRLEIAVPAELRLPEVVLPAAGQWTIEEEPREAGKRSVLRVNLAQGVEGDANLILRGKLPALDAQGEMPLPRLEVLGAKRQEGDIAVQADPAFNVEVRDLRACEETERERVSVWLDAPLRAATRAALHYADGTYAGRLRLVARKPEVACDTITNVKITDREIKETILLNYEIRNAGIREVSFLLPAAMRDARISTPLLRRKTIEPVDTKAADGPLRVRLELQSDAMNDLRVEVQNDRLLTPGSHVAPLPAFEGGRAADFVQRQYVVLESTNRDELVVDPPVGLEPLSRQQQQWQVLCGLLGTNNLYQAYLVEPGAAAPRLSFHLQAHEDLETAGARIDLAQTTMVLDANGACRAKVEFTLDNSSEQFLDVELPAGVELWTVHVAGEPVKPVMPPGAKDTRHVLLPVVKTAKGDPSYQVVLKYGGNLPPLSAFSAVRFPLVRNVKSYPAGNAIGIERSQLEVYLPRSHDWYGFGGTLQRADEAQQKAAKVAALNQEGQRLTEAARDKDPFTRLRATKSLEEWAARARNVQADSGRVQDQALQSEIGFNAGTLAQAKELLAKSPQANQPQEGEATADNRERLNELYQKQVVKNATGTLTLNGANSYSGGTTVSAGILATQSGADFNGNWITRNNLNGGLDTNGTGDVSVSALGREAEATKSGAGGLVLANSANSYGGATAIFGGTIQSANANVTNSAAPPQFGGVNTATSPAGEMGAQSQGQQQSNAQNFQSYSSNAAANNYRADNGDEQQRELAQYQQKLSSAKGEGKGQSYGTAALGTTASMVAGANAAIIGNEQGGFGPASSTVVFKDGKEAGKWRARGPSPEKTAVAEPAAGPTGVSDLPAAPTGLASLDFQLPTDNELYQLYRFTPPRGEAELTARTVGTATETKLLLLAGVLVIGLLIWSAARLARRGALGWLRHPLGAALLLVIGIAMLCEWALPVVAFAAIIAGTWLLTAGLIARSRRGGAAAA